MALDSGGSLSDGWANVSSAPVFPVAIVLILAFNIACAFLDVWDMVIDTIFQCYCMDEEYGTGKTPGEVLLVARFVRVRERWCVRLRPSTATRTWRGRCILLLTSPCQGLLPFLAWSLALLSCLVLLLSRLACFLSMSTSTSADLS